MVGLVFLVLLFGGYLGWIGWCLIVGWWPNRDGYTLIQRYWPWGHRPKALRGWRRP